MNLDGKSIDVTVLKQKHGYTLRIRYRGDNVHEIINIPSMALRISEDTLKEVRALPFEREGS